jgi:hypothetical protein
MQGRSPTSGQRQRGRWQAAILAASLGLCLVFAGSLAQAQTKPIAQQPPPADDVETLPAIPIITGSPNSTPPADDVEALPAIPIITGSPTATPPALAIPDGTPIVPGTNQPYVPTYAPPQDGPPGQAQPSFVNTHNEPKSDEKARLSNVPIGLQPIPPRPPLLVELNDHFLSPGFLSPGFALPTGEVVRPSLWVWGVNQVDYDWFNSPASGTKNISEMPERLDLFAQLNLTATDRIVYGIRPFDQERLNQRVYTSVGFNPDYSPSRDGLNADVETLFYESDLSQLFPGLDPYDTRHLDYGFSVGRQPLLVQEGLLINADQLDAVTVTRNTINHDLDLNTRATFMYAWDRVHRNDDDYDPSARLYGFFTETDFHKLTVNVDLVYVSADNPSTGSAYFAAFSAIERMEIFHQTFNESFHVLTSVPEEQTAAAGRGTLLFNEFSYTPHGTPSLVYLSTFWAIDNFSSAARNPEVGGPLGQTGLLYASPALGRFGSPLSNQASDAVGFALGWQIVLDSTRRSIDFELGGRDSTIGGGAGQVGFGIRYQRAFGQHHALILDTFVSKAESFDVATGVRVVWLTKF